MVLVKIRTTPTQTPEPRPSSGHEGTRSVRTREHRMSTEQPPVDPKQVIDEINALMESPPPQRPQASPPAPAAAPQQLEATRAYAEAVSQSAKPQQVQALPRVGPLSPGILEMSRRLQQELATVRVVLETLERHAMQLDAAILQEQQTQQQAPPQWIQVPRGYQQPQYAPPPQYHYPPPQQFQAPGGTPVGDQNPFDQPPQQPHYPPPPRRGNY